MLVSGFTPYIVPLPKSDRDIYWSDYANTYLTDKYGKDYSDNKYLIFTFFLDNQGEINRNTRIKVSYTDMNVDHKKTVIDIFDDGLNIL